MIGTVIAAQFGLAAFRQSIVAGLSVLVIAIISGTLFAALLTYGRLYEKNVVEKLVLPPLALPGIILDGFQVWVWSQMRFGFTPSVHAIFVCIGLATFALVVLSQFLIRKKSTGQA